jgi:hypothetical protein
MAAWIHYQRGPHRRVWRKGPALSLSKGFSEYLVEEGIAEPEAPAVAVDRGAVLATVVVLLNLMVIAILIVATWYMWHEGAKDLMYWLSRLGR